MAEKYRKNWAFLAIVSLITLCCGCSKSEQKPPEQTKTVEPEKKSMSEAWSAKKGESEDSNANPKEQTKTVATTAKSKLSPQPLTIPKVGLTDALRATCLVNVGDVISDASVIASTGSKVDLKSEYGKKLTVVFFWTKGTTNYAQLTANSALLDLQEDVAEPYSAKGLKVLGVQVGVNPKTAAGDFEKSGAKFSHYFDPNGAFFGKLTTGKLPRVYLLDASGKILWFDTEFSLGTRRNLVLAIQVALGEK